MRAGVELTTEKLGMVECDDIVEIIDATRDGARLRIEDPYEGWISAKVLLPHSVEDTREGLKKAPIELNESFEEVWGKGVDPKEYESPYNYNPEDAHNKLPPDQLAAMKEVEAHYNRNKPFSLSIQDGQAK